MSAASVLTAPQYDLHYGAIDELTQLGTVVTTNIAAYIDADNTPRNLSIGASSNLVGQAVKGIYLEHGSTDRITMSTSSGAITTQYLSIGLSNSRVTLVDKRSAGLSLQTKDTLIGSMRFVEDASKMTLSMPSLGDGLSVLPAVAMQSTLAVALDTSLNQNLYVTGDTGMGGKLVTYGGVYTPDLALYKNSSNNGVAQVGYSFKINDRDQLELVKYTFFDAVDAAVAKKVAVYGTGSIGSSEMSDVLYEPSLITGSGTGGSSIGGSNTAPGFTNIGSLFSMTQTSNVYSMNSLTLGSSNVNTDYTLQVVGATQSTTFLAASNISSPAFLTTSDARLKNIHEPINGPDALNAIMGLSPLNYSWKTDGTGRKHPGFIAQNIAAMMPRAVQVVPKGDLEDAMHIDNTALMAYLVAAVQELGSRVLGMGLDKDAHVLCTGGCK
ncbi:hypothetical protein TSOC_013771 [Tetrabaena socialis]|uniref:Peptidase S74 domain-containing protein n=1 Tax=Tetrabaena socialis TaxID=47790 RepID=A0A2J7ZJG9_9CHLO|nr:hypothetical protein TSOC_013771 [Tetrabaena socialis]|eukprot:PNH00406.1 hypothetical protein TSOC_013771 [Tetrabaena socialis]